MISQKNRKHWSCNGQEGSSISRQNLKENLETLHLAPSLFSHLPGFYLKTWCLNPRPFSLEMVGTIVKFIGQQIKTIHQSDQVRLDYKSWEIPKTSML